MARRRFYEGFEAGGLRVERFGRFVSMRNVRTRRQHRESMRRAAEFHSQAPGQIAKQVTELESILERYDPLDIIANVASMNLSAET